jgi:hypothetical protein
MGTNFYLGNMPDDADDVPCYHIGKRSAAGLYCWDCGRTLCKGGEFWVHLSGAVKLYMHPNVADHYKNCGDWFDECPICGAKPDAEGMDTSAGGRELGFNTSAPAKKTGVRSCASFTWAMMPRDVWREIKEHGVVDEYGCKYTATEFSEVLSECPLQSFSSIGEQFS